ncbi:hypothetical protein HK098_001102 [Nowakowskiella sp. JEL0407]|nr:hypothetical protein HK098_001102 [Nowakowskiella sp. JEL0407]
MSPRRVAVVGSGIAGLSAAYLLSQSPEEFSVSLFESGDYFGGHSNTVDVPSLTDPNVKAAVDTGFIVFNPVTYPNLIAFLKHLNVETILSSMTFSVSKNQGEFEWAGDNLDTIFAQRSNILPFTFGGWSLYRMLYDLVRFHLHAKAVAAQADEVQFDENGNVREGAVLDSTAGLEVSRMTLAAFFKKFGYSSYFQENYIMPITAAIWSTPASMAFESFPVVTLLRFMRNHMMLQIGGRPKWRTLLNGSRSYVKEVLKSIPYKHLNTKIVKIERPSDPDSEELGKVILIDENGDRKVFDHVIFATHCDQTLQILGDGATEDEKKILGSVKFVNNRAILHRDPNLMPKIRKTWSSWNYLTKVDKVTKAQQLSLSYWMNKLQPYVDEKIFGPVVVTLNPLWEPAKDKILGEYNYTHPLYTSETIAAQDQLNKIQNKHNTTFCGAWTNYGFHEDGITSGLLAATSLGAKCPFTIIPNGGYPTHREPPMPPVWAQKKGAQRYQCGSALYVRDRKPISGLTNSEVKFLGGVTFFVVGVIVAVASYFLF